MGSYSVKVSSEKTMEEGICRRRLWNNVGDSQTPVFRGRQILRKSREESYEISLVCPGEWVLEPGTPARINDGLLGTQKNLRVDKVVYLLDQSGERTEILLRKTEEE